MAVRESATTNGAETRRVWFVATCLVVLFVAALFLRAYWNLEAANPSPGEYVLSGGSDPYYHKYAADQIQANGFRHQAVIEDPLLNYPLGSENPNPPLYEWIIAAGGKFLDPVISGDLAQATWEVAIWSPAVIGALTVVPLYFLGAALFDRRVGLVAALLWTVSTAAIDSTGLGLADHDALVVFFVTLSMLFYVQTIRHFRGEVNWVARWPQGIGAGLGRLFRERGTGFAFALLAGVSMGALALTWKGSNYVLGIVLIYAGLQLVADHFRNRDTTGLYAATLLATLVSVLMAWPFYQAANVANFLMPAWYLVGFFAIAGAVLVTTRDLPSLLVLPIMILVGAIGLVGAFFVFPTVAQSLLHALVYFKQSRLYQTISEAQGADFSTIAFGIGPVAYLLALAGWFILLFRVAARPVQATIATSAFLLTALVVYILLSNIGDGTLAFTIVGIILMVWLLVMFSLADSAVARTHAFALLWAAVALFMAQSAVRFLINAVPVFVLFAAFMTIWVLDWLDFGAIRKSLAANRGNAWQGIRKGTRPLHIVGVILIALLFVFPTTILAADAALPYESEQRIQRDAGDGFVGRFFSERMGAYGGSFISVAPWIPAFGFLDQHDAAIADPKDRPAFLSWWDYGHWAISIGKHPTVADNFQNGYEFAANFILSQDETHAIQLLASRLAEAEGADPQAALAAAGSADAAGDAARLARWEKLNLTMEQSVDLVARLEVQTGKSIRYFGVDARMLPFDFEGDPRQIEVRDIFAAPVTLKGETPDDYVTRKVQLAAPVGGQSYVTRERYEEIASDPIRPTQVTGERYEYQQKFFDSMFWRAYVGTQPEAGQPGQPTLGGAVQQALDYRNVLSNSGPRPGLGLQHFRAIYVGNATGLAYVGSDPETGALDLLRYPDVIILEYTPGATVRGTVTEEGSPLGGVTVTAFDDIGLAFANAFQLNTSAFDVGLFNVPHAQATTAADGSFEMVVPFGNVTLTAQRGDVGVATANVIVTREEANARATKDVTISVARGSVSGIAYRDVDGNATYDASIDTPAAGVELIVGGVRTTTGPDGTYSVSGVSAGSQPVATTAADLKISAGTTVIVRGGANVTHNVAIDAADAFVSGTLRNATGGFVGTITFERKDVEGNTARNDSVVSSPSGEWGPKAIRPGSYTLRATQIDGEVTRTATRDIEIAPGDSVTGIELVALADGETAPPSTTPPPEEPPATNETPAANDTNTTPAP